MIASIIHKARETLLPACLGSLFFYTGLYPIMGYAYQNAQAFDTQKGFFEGEFIAYPLTESSRPAGKFKETKEKNANLLQAQESIFTMYLLARSADHLLRNNVDSCEWYLRNILQIGQASQDTLTLSMAFCLLGSLHKTQGQYAAWSKYLSKSLDLANHWEARQKEPFLPQMHSFLVWLEDKSPSLSLTKPIEIAKHNNLALVLSQIDLLMYETYQHQTSANASSPPSNLENYRLLFDDLPTINSAGFYSEDPRQFPFKNIYYLTGGILLLSLLLFLWIFRQKPPLGRVLVTEHPFAPLKHLTKNTPPHPITIEKPLISDEETEKQEPTEEETHGQNKMRKELYNLLIKRLEEEKLYLDPELNLNKLTTLLQTNKRYLYEAISNHTQDNFKDLVNAFRVRAAQDLIEQIARQELQTETSKIYLQAGFNSMTSYYRVFKKHTGVTPNQYAEDYKTRGMP
jgi:AraC-like DNA-binding protein